MANNFEGMLTGQGLKFGLVVARFNEFITQKLLDELPSQRADNLA